MTTRRPLGRAASKVKTPLLVLEYLSGRRDFPGDEEGERDLRTSEGDYVSRIHQRVKLAILELDPSYQYPRSHSFHTLVNHLRTLGLVEYSERTEEPQERGAGQVGTDGGFHQRRWVRLTDGSATRAEWLDPIGYIAERYPGVRSVGGVLPVAQPFAEPAASPAPRRRRRAPAPPAEEAVAVPPRRRGPTPAPTPTTVDPEAVAALERQRQAVVRVGERLASGGTNAEQFGQLLRGAELLVGQVRDLLGPQPFAGVETDLDLLRSCIEILEDARELDQRRIAAVRNCRNSTRIVLEALARPLRAPTAQPATGRARRRAAQVVTLATPEFPNRLTAPTVQKLGEHLTTVRDVVDQLPDQEVPENTPVAQEMDRLATVVQNWVNAVQDMIDKEEQRSSPRESRLEELQGRIEALEAAVEALKERDVSAAIESLEGYE